MIWLLHCPGSVPHAMFDHSLIPCFPQPVRPVIIILSLVDHIVTIIVTLSITFLTITLIDRLAEIFGWHFGIKQRRSGHQQNSGPCVLPTWFCTCAGNTSSLILEWRSNRKDFELKQDYFKIEKNISWFCHSILSCESLIPCHFKTVLKRVINKTTNLCSFGHTLFHCLKMAVLWPYRQTTWCC